MDLSALLLESEFRGYAFPFPYFDYAYVAEDLATDTLSISVGLFLQVYVRYMLSVINIKYTRGITTRILF